MVNAVAVGPEVSPHAATSDTSAISSGTVHDLTLITWVPSHAEHGGSLRAAYLTAVGER